jgi:hypothetical protein
MASGLHRLSVSGMAIVIFALTYLVAGAIYAIVMRLAKGERARAFQKVSPGLLPPLGILFALLVAFIANQVWGDFDRANAAVNREASALRAVVLLAPGFPGEPERRLRALVRRQIDDAVTQEWPAMAGARATLVATPTPLAEAMQVILALDPQGAGQATAHRELLLAVENALDARRQRIITSQSSVNGVKWAGVILQALCTLVAIAMVHCDNRRSAAYAVGIFATGVAVSLLLICAHDRPFAGPISVGPGVLQQVMPMEGKP